MARRPKNPGQRQRNMVRETSLEIELLIRCVHPSGALQKPDRVRELLAGDPDWERVLELGDTHGVTPLLARNLTVLADEKLVSLVPDSIQSRLAERARSTALYNVHIAGEMREILNSFEERGIRALPFKGPVLAAFAYDDVGLRRFGDLDLLVVREDVSNAVDVLEARGYVWEEVPRLDDSALLGGPFTKALVPEYELERENLSVEVRWRVGDPDRRFSPDVETLWMRREYLEVGATEVPVLSPEDRLLVLAFHGTKHRWHLLKWVCDFVAALEQTDVVWSRLLRRARRHQLERKLLIGVALAEELFDVTVSDLIRDRVDADEHALPLAEQAIEKLHSGIPTRPVRTERIAYNAKASDSVGDGLRTVLYHSRFHPGVPEYQLFPLRGPLHPLYYLVFPARLIVERSPSFRRDV